MNYRSVITDEELEALRKRNELSRVAARISLGDRWVLATKVPKKPHRSVLSNPVTRSR